MSSAPIRACSWHVRVSAAESSPGFRRIRSLIADLPDVVEQGRPDELVGAPPFEPEPLRHAAHVRRRLVGMDEQRAVLRLDRLGEDGDRRDEGVPQLVAEARFVESGR